LAVLVPGAHHHERRIRQRLRNDSLDSRSYQQAGRLRGHTGRRGGAGAAQNAGKILEVPIHYEERRAGKSKMKALRHTWALLKACWHGFWRVKYPRSNLGSTEHDLTHGVD
jgi:hypothetical protein